MGDQELEVSLASAGARAPTLRAAPAPADRDAGPRRGHAVSYVVAGYAIALGALFVYAVSLVLRRRRWERAPRVSDEPAAEAEGRRRRPASEPS